MKKKRNIHRSTEDWHSILHAFRSSGLTQEEFCKKHQLPHSTFSKWKKQLRSSASPTSSDFIELSSTPQEPKPVTIKSRFELSISFANSFRFHMKMA